MTLEETNYLLYNEHTDNSSIVAGIKSFAELPYKQGEYDSRHWGNKRHSLCSYPSKLTPSIPYHLVKTFTSKGDTILDPMAGVGTIPFEACLNGRKGIGNDLNPLAYTVTRAKIKSYDPMRVRIALGELKTYISEHRQEYSVEDVEAEICEFFHDETLCELLAAKDFFKTKEEDRYYLLKAALSHILHGNRPYALSRRSHNVIPIPPKGEFEYNPIIDSLSDKIERTLKVDLPSTFIEGDAYQQDAFTLDQQVQQVDAIITSPPFLKSTEFLRQNRVRLWFNGWNYETQEKMKEEFLENMPLSKYVELLDVFHDCIKEAGLCVFHTGVVNGEDMAQQIADESVEYGFNPLGIIYEQTEDMESQGRTDRGSTKQHQFLLLRKDS